jgi:hypothetical protein
LIDPENIYNDDELGLFWRMQAKSSYIVKDSICKYGKQSKDRMTVFVFKFDLFKMNKYAYKHDIIVFTFLKKKHPKILILGNLEIS